MVFAGHPLPVSFQSSSLPSQWPRRQKLHEDRFATDSLVPGGLVSLFVSGWVAGWVDVEVDGFWWLILVFLSFIYIYIYISLLYPIANVFCVCEKCQCLDTVYYCICTHWHELSVNCQCFWSPSSVIFWPFYPFWSRPDVWLKSPTSVASSHLGLWTKCWPHLDSIVIGALFCAYWHVDIPMFASIKNHAGKVLGKNKLQNTADAKQTPNLPSNTTTMRPVAFSDLLCRKWIFVYLCVIVNHHRICWDGITSIWNHQEVQVLLLLTTETYQDVNMASKNYFILHPIMGLINPCCFVDSLRKNHGFSMVFPYDFGCCPGNSTKNPSLC